MPNKLEYEYIKDIYYQNGYILVSLEYKNAITKLLLKDIEGYYYLSRFNDFQNSNKVLYKFANFNPYTIQNIKLWCELNNKPFELLSDKYEGVDKKLQWKCLKENCKEVFYSSWHDIYAGYGCGFCHGLQVGISNCLAIKNPELTKEWNYILNKNLTPYNVTANSSKKVWWKCKECGHKWEGIISNRNNGSGCPKCNKSKGEKRIEQYFITINFKLNEDYISQKEFKGLIGIGGGNLSYDFYLPNYNLLIEYQGEFHDGNTRRQTKKDIQRQQEHDKRKKEYALKNNINLLEIWYWDFDIIDEILNKELDNYK